MLATLAIDDELDDVGIIAQSGAYGEGLADVFAAEFDGGGRSSAKYPFESETDLSLAITNGIGLGKIAATIHPYPTQAEVIKKAADQWRRTKLTPTVQRLFRLWFRLFS